MFLIKRVQRYILYAYIFYIIYTPIFAPGFIFDRYILLYALLPVLLVPYLIRRDSGVFSILAKRSVLILMSLILVSSIYYALLQVYHNNGLSSLVDLRLVQNNIINVMIIHVAIIIDKLKKIEYTKRDALSLIIKFGAFQGVVCALSFLIPELKDIAISLYQLAGGSNSYVIESRVFGISSDYTYGTQIYHGLLAAFSINEAIKYRKKYYYLFALLILIAVFLNGRTGLLVFAAATFILIMYAYYKRGAVYKAFISLGLVALFVVSIFSTLQSISPGTYGFINSFVEDTNNLIFKKETTGNYDVLFNTSLRFPAGWSLVSGEGLHVYDSASITQVGFRSDIGYVNDIYMFGLLFTALIYCGIFYFVFCHSRGHRILAAALMLVLLLANFKGEALRSSIIIFIILFVKIVETNLKEWRENVK